jgi:hypothetical protein
MRFVLLQHDPPPASQAFATHWDFMLEVPGQERLATWRLAANPVVAADPIAAERIADHRRAYLDYEGEVSSGRGRVTRIDGGEATIERRVGAELVVGLMGVHLAGRFTCCQTATGLRFSRT